MLSISGFGEDSSRRKRGAFAPTIHAATGVLDYAGMKAQQPLRPTGDAGADITTALQAAIALLAALRRAERTGEGDHVELAMYDTVLASYSETPFVLVEPPEDRYDTDPFDAGSNGFIAVAGPPQFVWAELAQAFEIADPAPPGADVPTKARLRRATIEAWMTAQPSAQSLIDQLEAAGLASARVETLREALTGDYARERQLLHDVDDRKGGTRRVTRLPYRFTNASVEARRPAPRLGEHNEEVLRELLDLPAARLRGLQQSKVLLSAD
jgi:crotonobetainyl-CoA:carnitine CoA-transferase CaiB-like acyl-CoA transferase